MYIAILTILLCDYPRVLQDPCRSYTVEDGLALASHRSLCQAPDTLKPLPFLWGFRSQQKAYKKRTLMFGWLQVSLISLACFHVCFMWFFGCLDWSSPHNPRNSLGLPSFVTSIVFFWFCPSMVPASTIVNLNGLGHTRSHSSVFHELSYPPGKVRTSKAHFTCLRQGPSIWWFSNDLISRKWSFLTTERINQPLAGW